ncbi:MAG: response regulator [Dehalococcoidia bacterium]
MNGSIRILLVDDHEVVRQGLRRMLDMEEDLEVVGEAANVQEALAQVESLSPDVVLLDIKMPGIDGVEAIRLLKERQTKLRIIMLTLYEEHLAQAIEAGADGYLLKDTKGVELAQAVRAVQQGHSPLGPGLSQRLFAEFATLAKESTERRSHLFSDRELSILRLIAAGATTKEAASQLFLSDASVKRAIRHVFTKLGARNRSEAISEAYKRNLI